MMALMGWFRNRVRPPARKHAAVAISSQNRVVLARPMTAAAIVVAKVAALSGRPVAN